jgi:hypothetical protein
MAASTRKSAWKNLQPRTQVSWQPMSLLLEGGREIVELSGGQGRRRSFRAV